MGNRRSHPVAPAVGQLAVEDSLLTFLLRVTAFLSVLFLIVDALMLPGSEGWIRLGFGVLLSGALWLGVLRPQWPLAVRAGLLVSALYLFAVSSLLVQGLTDEARLPLLVMPIVVIVLVGIRAGTAVGVLTLVTVWIAAAAQQQGTLPLYPAELVAYAAGANWPGIVLLFGLMALLALVTLGRVLFGIDVALRAQQAQGAALEGERLTLEQRVQVRERALRTGIAISEIVADARDTDGLATAVAEQVQRSTGYGRVAFFMHNEPARRLTMRANHLPEGPDMEMQPAVWRWGEGVVGRAASENRLLSIPPDVAQRWEAGEDAPASLLAAPIALGERVLGVMLVMESGQRLGQEDAALMTAVASQVAGALQNLQAVAWAEQRARRQAVVNELSRRIQATTDVDEALRVAVEGLNAALGAGRSAVEIHSPVRETAVGEE